MHLQGKSFEIAPFRGAKDFKREMFAILTPEGKAVTAGYTFEYKGERLGMVDDYDVSVTDLNTGMVIGRGSTPYKALELVRNGKFAEVKQLQHYKRAVERFNNAKFIMQGSKEEERLRQRAKHSGHYL